MKDLIAQKRRTAADDFQGRKYVKRSDLDAARLSKLRDEEEAEKKLHTVRQSAAPRACHVEGRAGQCTGAGAATASEF